MSSIGLYSYSVAAIAFLMLGILLATGWQGRSQGIRLIVACGATSAWAAFLAAASMMEEPPAYLVAFAECLRDGAWISVLSGLAATAGVAVALSRALNVAWILSAAYLLTAPALSRAGFSILLPEVALVANGFGFALGGLILLEQVYRNSHGEGRSALRLLAIALATTWVYDVFLYSQAQLVHGMDPETWNARGLVVTLTVPLIALAARRNPQWSLEIFVSRQVVFYTTTLLAVGAYLLVMAVGGYAIRLYGGTWGTAMQAVFLAGAGVVLVAVLASGSLRRRLSVFLSKHFYRNRYDYRVEWLRFIETLSVAEPGTDPNEVGVRAIAQVFGSPGGVLYALREAEQRFEAVAAWPRGRVDLARYPPVLLDDELPSFMRRREWVVDVTEHAAEPDLYENIVLPRPLGTGDPHRMIVPLQHGQSLLGFVALEAPPPPFHPNYEDRDLLKTLGRHVAIHLAQYEADRRLAESRQFEAYHRLTAFVMHDLKNLVAQLALIVTNAAQHKRNPEFVDDAISTIANSTARMQRLIEQLQRREEQRGTRRVALAQVASRAAERCSDRSPVPVLEPGAADVEVECDVDRLVMIVEHVIRNAQDATPESGSVSLSVGLGASASAEPGSRVDSTADTGETSRLLRVPHALLAVSDTGSGMTREFIQERLFRPFDTTKGSKGMGIGAYQVREYVQSLGGRVEVQSEPGRGTRFTLLLPLTSA